MRSLSQSWAVCFPLANSASIVNVGVVSLCCKTVSEFKQSQCQPSLTEVWVRSRSEQTVLQEKSSVDVTE